METYDLLLKKDSGELKFKRLSTNDISGIVDLFKEHDLLDDVSSMYFILIVNKSDDAPEVKMRNSFKLVGDSLEFCDILKEGDTIWNYINSLSKEVKLSVSSGNYEVAVGLKETLKIVEKISAEYDFSDDVDPDSEMEFAEWAKTTISEKFGNYQKATSNDWAGVECYWEVKEGLFLIFTDESSVELITKHFDETTGDNETENLGIANNFTELDSLYATIDEYNDFSFDDKFKTTALYPYGDNPYAIQIISKTKARIKGNKFGWDASIHLVDINEVNENYYINFDGKRLKLEDFDFIESDGYVTFLNLDDSPNNLETIRMYFKMRLNDISDKEYIIQSIEDGMEFEKGEWVDISEQVDIDSETFLFVISGEIKQGTSEYILQSIEDGMEFEEGEYIEELTETEYVNIANTVENLDDSGEIIPLNELFKFLNLEGFDEAELNDIEYIAEKVQNFPEYYDGYPEINDNLAIILAQKYVDNVMSILEDDIYNTQLKKENLLKFRNKNSNLNESAYHEFFKEKLEEYGVNSPSELDDTDIKQFFNEMKNFNG